MPGKVKAYELQSKYVSSSPTVNYTLMYTCHRSKNDLTKQLSELKMELLNLRVQKIAGGSASKLTKM